MFVHVHLLLGHQVTAKAKGVRLGRVSCQHCGEEYVYQLRRTAQGSAYAFLHMRTAQKKAQARAAADQKLENLFLVSEDEVPCPTCGHLQPHMLQKWRKRQRRHWWVGLLISILLLPVMVIVANFNRPFAPFTWEAFLPFILLIVLVMGSWAFWILRRNPSTRAHRHTREALGPRCRAMPAAEFDALLEETPENNDFSA